MILGHRLSELCGHGPNLETDIALTNISLDLFGQVRSYFQYAAKLKGEGVTEDDVAFLRYDREYRNVLLVEQPNTDFAHVIVRQFLFDSFHVPLLAQLVESQDETIAAIASKSIKEARYHLRFSSEWIKRLGDGTDESGKRLMDALMHLYPYVHELFKATEIESEALNVGIGSDLQIVKENAMKNIVETLHQVAISVPETSERKAHGKEGIHSEYMGHILSELQYMQRAYPNMEW